MATPTTPASPSDEPGGRSRAHRAGVCLGIAGPVGPLGTGASLVVLTVTGTYMHRPFLVVAWLARLGDGLDALYS